MTSADAPAARDTVTPGHRRLALEKAGLWDDSTLVGRVAAFARSQPAKTAVVDQLGTRRRSYADLDRDAGRLAGYLRQAGVRAGDVVSVQLPNWYETVVAGLGTLRIGAVLNPLLPIYRAHELHGVLATARSRVLFTPTVYRRFDYPAMVGQLRDQAPPFSHVSVSDPALAPDLFDAWLDAAPGAEGAQSAQGAAVSELIFSSGTEATPKAIMHTEQTTNFGMRAAAGALRIGTDEVVWMPSPIGHSTGFNYGVRMALYHGATLVLQDQWDTAAAVSLIQEHRCTYTVIATTFLSDIIDHVERTGGDLSCLRLCSSGGAPVSPAVVSRAAELGLSVLRLYGSTEVLIGSWNRPDSPLDKRLNTDGAPPDHVELVVRDDAGTAVRNQPGELFVRSPSTCVGFLNDPARTASTFDADGWVRTGDIGTLDDDGYFTMVGRKKEILIRGGLNVAPREVEELIAQMPGVAAVAVVPLPDERLGEIGCACVVPSGTAAPTLEQVVDFLRRNGLATYKLPERLEVFGELPSTVTGKVQKFEIIRAVTARQATPADRREGYRQRCD